MRSIDPTGWFTQRIAGRRPIGDTGHIGFQGSKLGADMSADVDGTVALTPQQALIQTNYRIGGGYGDNARFEQRGNVAIDAHNNEDSIGTRIDGIAEGLWGNADKPWRFSADGRIGGEFAGDKSEIFAELGLEVPVLGRVAEFGGNVEILSGQDDRYGADINIGMGPIGIEPRGHVTASEEETSVTIGYDVSIPVLQFLGMGINLPLSIDTTAGHSQEQGYFIRTSADTPLGEFSMQDTPGSSSIEGPLGQFDPSRIWRYPPSEWIGPAPVDETPPEPTDNIADKPIPVPRISQPEPAALDDDPPEVSNIADKPIPAPSNSNPEPVALDEDPPMLSETVAPKPLPVPRSGQGEAPGLRSPWGTLNWGITA